MNARRDLALIQLATDYHEGGNAVRELHRRMEDSERRERRERWADALRLFVCVFLMSIIIWSLAR